MTSMIAVRYAPNALVEPRSPIAPSYPAQASKSASHPEMTHQGSWSPVIPHPPNLAIHISYSALVRLTNYTTTTQSYRSLHKTQHIKMRYAYLLAALAFTAPALAYPLAKNDQDTNIALPTEQQPSEVQAVSSHHSHYCHGRHHCHPRHRHRHHHGPHRHHHGRHGYWHRHHRHYRHAHEHVDKESAPSSPTSPSPEPSSSSPGPSSPSPEPSSPSPEPSSPSPEPSSPSPEPSSPSPEPSSPSPEPSSPSPEPSSPSPEAPSKESAPSSPTSPSPEPSSPSPEVPSKESAPSSPTSPSHVPSSPSPKALSARSFEDDQVGSITPRKRGPGAWVVAEVHSSDDPHSLANRWKTLKWGFFLRKHWHHSPPWMAHIRFSEPPMPEDDTQSPMDGDFAFSEPEDDREFMFEDDTEINPPVAAGAAQMRLFKTSGPSHLSRSSSDHRIA
ncbi:hypothetical protein DACRYDRAFT_118019 [Dacryopinax primogenitus]|uniref:Uncharacterized protein n=1 Tax=Dacryopinax primogenitus (strain DJM 731) TaxID=1858805 RepID=M5G671_DACPD|nr:uncharacterized protein DACRYDRAFT_118019 [Dacryopinax primogenitus]EJT99262.1 hypothetical protein DACRYDRAFT_118019 [Dacryopinax primogenitus]